VGSAAVAAVGAVLLGATLASAHGGGTSLIHGCRNNFTGVLRIVGANDNCFAWETALDWTQDGGGPSGPSGPTGPASS